MTKTELLAVISSSYKNVSSPELIETVGDVRHYLVNFLEISEDGKEAIKRNSFFYVFKEGQQDESAYFKTDASGNAIIPATEFKKEVITFLDEEVNAEKILKYTIVSCDEIGKFAEVKCLVDSSGDAKWESCIVLRILANPIARRRLVS